MEIEDGPYKGPQRFNRRKGGGQLKPPEFSKIWGVFLVILFSLLIGSEIYLLASMGEDNILSSSEKGWTGASDFVRELERRGYDVVPLLTTPSLIHEEESPLSTLFVSLGPEREYSLSEIHAIKKFHDRGGKILLADDSGNSNELASRFDVNFVKGQLYDQNFVSNPDLVKFKVSVPFFDGFILMNKPASLTFSSGQALIASSTSAWVDRNGNGINDNVTTNQGEAQGIRYLAVISDPDFDAMASGTCVMISDPSLFMNGMIDREDNLALALTLVELMLPDGGKIVFDDSVHSSDGGIGVMQKGLLGIAFLTTDVNFKIVIGSIAVLAMFAVGYVYESPKRPRHETILERTGVAELVEPDLLESDLDELKKAVLDRIRVSHDMSVEDFSNLTWDQIGEISGNDEIIHFIKKGKFKGGVEGLLLEVLEWERK
jgi:hypothetical protein